MCKTTPITVFTFFCCMFNNCGKEYNSKFNLKRHVEIYHLKSKQVQCPICFKFFRIKQNLVEHSYIHSKQKPYRCSWCRLSFRHKSSLLKHDREKHRKYT